MSRCSFLLVLLVLTACRNEMKRPVNGKQTDNQQSLLEIMDADKAFSDACEKNGMRKAFLEYLADDAVLLRPGHMPIVEGDVVKFISSMEDTSFTMSWKPRGGNVAASADMGYTYGVYKIVTGDSVLTGTYLSLWRKQEDGSWKIVLDTGNQGTGE